MILSLKIAENTGTILRLGRSKIWRYVFIGMALSLILGIILIREAPLLFLVIIGICLFAGFYDDRWLFDREKNILFQSSGIGPLRKRREFRIDTFNRISLKSAVSSGFTSETIGASKVPAFPELFRRGRSSLWLEFKNDTPKFLIDEGTHWDRSSLENMGTAIAAWCHVPFEGFDSSAKES